MQASSDQIIEQMSDEHQQTIADFEHKIAALHSELETARIIKPKSVKDVAVGIDVPTPSSESSKNDSSQSPTKNTAAKSTLTIQICKILQSNVALVVRRLRTTEKHTRLRLGEGRLRSSERGGKVSKTCAG